MQTRDVTFIICLEGQWQMAPQSACDAGVSELAGEHRTGRFCCRVTSGCQQGRDVVKLVAWGHKERGGENEDIRLVKFSYSLGE